MIGRLNKRISVQIPTETADGMGGFTTVWSNLVTVWAAIWPVSAKEQIQSMSNTMEVTHRIRIRFRSDVLHNYRIVFESIFATRYFNIISIVNPNEQNRWLDIMAKEVT